jgi:hypothetical protein
MVIYFFHLQVLIKILFEKKNSLTFESVVLFGLNISSLFESILKSEPFIKNSLFQRRILSISQLRFTREMLEVFFKEKLIKL